MTTAFISLSSHLGLYHFSMRHISLLSIQFNNSQAYTQLSIYTAIISGSLSFLFLHQNLLNPSIFFLNLSSTSLPLLLRLPFSTLSYLFYLFLPIFSFYSSLLFSTVLFSSLLFSTSLYFTILCFTVLCSTSLYSISLCSTSLYSISLHVTLLYSNLLHSFTLLHLTLLYFTPRYFTLLQSSSLYFSLLHLTLLYFSLLYLTFALDELFRTIYETFPIQETNVRGCGLQSHTCSDNNS